MTDITELTGAPKHANQHRISRIIVESPNDELRQMTVEVEQYTDQLIEALEKAQQRITQLESRTVKLPDDEDGQAYGFGKWANGKLPATAGTMTIAYCEDAWRAAFEVFSSTAGIKVEAE
ncbi:hypothetical protein RZ761_14390 [Klebsiella pasteurii]|uniref:Ead/Ea22-like family protein n=1 Tax=Klebsiella pasteurii TaxID=2587529 RepID=A0ABT5CW84_9ENTR|nr:hypothetical protein [Klebsiella pasteurii]MDC0694346.1 hypothetical protein [Klebsiella pasteurii]MDC0756398.1 hypothetical protein [Klebsiella pasteurii]MDQ2169255.1 hypothetical protein [Klebsiella pasteurii]MDQ2201665.1 hypothetical protein [Klebsiella pasteurii]MDQ2225417.1 hypothetical protein [Klebsiella pasteurii]